MNAHLVKIQGAVQGVGFRPFVYRLAHDLNLSGWVRNDAQGVEIHIEGPENALTAFIERLPLEAPPHALINNMTVMEAATQGYAAFTIEKSGAAGQRSALILPDLATCPDCLREIMDPADRRYRYPFTNCTNCGPRFSIITALPYDRPSTTMHRFTMCPECQTEYENPLDRRFHAQPNACPVCGPQLALWNPAGDVLAERDDALLAAAEAIRRGEIVAVKGLGGFHLMVDARNEDAVNRLRQRKNRPHKPFALMVPSLEWGRALCFISEAEAAALTSAQAPIVLLRKKIMGLRPIPQQGSQTPAPHFPALCAEESGSRDCKFLAGARGWNPRYTQEQLHDVLATAPGAPDLGLMLPYTPLHHLLMAELGFPVVATSGNRSDEPICTDEHDALERLAGIADLFLVHNRPIVRPVDDSIIRIVNKEQQILRRTRGSAPLPITIKTERNLPTVLATGAHLKNTTAINRSSEIFISQHIGDLETPQAFQSFKAIIRDLQDIYALTPASITHDLHPDYLSTQYATQIAAGQGIPAFPVQHHAAHVYACILDNAIYDVPVLGISWDGTGYGTDGTIWGGEFLLVDGTTVTRAAHLAPFPLPGGDRAIKEPRRSALGLLYSLYGDAAFDLDVAPLAAFSDSEKRILRQMLEKGMNAPLTSSAGRWFDAVAALLNLCQQSSYEGDAAMRLEAAALQNPPNDSQTGDMAHFTPVHDNGTIILDGRELITDLLNGPREAITVAGLAWHFHVALVEAMIMVAQYVGVQHVALTGGCFQNRILTELAIQRLEQAGFTPLWHHQIPPNDGGIAPGQIMVALIDQLK